MVTKVSLQRLHFRLSLCHGTRHPIRRVNMAVQLLTPHQDQRMCLHPPEWFLWSVWLATVAVKKKFPFRLRATIVLRCERTLNYGVKSLLRSRLAYRFYGFDRGKFFEHL